jgi:hypothetical protein
MPKYMRTDSLHNDVYFVNMRLPSLEDRSHCRREYGRDNLGPLGKI